MCTIHKPICSLIRSAGYFYVPLCSTDICSTDFSWNLNKKTNYKNQDNNPKSYNQFFHRKMVSRSPENARQNLNFQKNNDNEPYVPSLQYSLSNYRAI